MADKRCMTQLDEDTVRMVTELRAKENRSESQMLAILIRDGLRAREESALGKEAPNADHS